MPGVEWLRPDGRSGDHGITLEEYTPFGVVAAMTSLLEPIMIVFLAVIVGSIVIAMFLPLIDLMQHMGDPNSGKGGE